MSKLLARAKVKRVNAEYDYQNISIDDAYIDDCCYNLEQAIEFALKYLVEMNGENYVENHDIRAQMNKLKSLNAYIPCEKELRLHASTINSWEVETRYNDNFVALIEDINDIKDIADAIIDYCDSLVKTLHDMKLYDDAFNLIKNKTKTIEMRLNDKKRKLLKKGDFIRFTNTLTGEKLIC
ncbi:MAG: HEPN domain-containing protein, partial [Bacilli bacterium]|nr:HEPN domain-containing protein [Bacilli bacterium]